LLPREGTDEMSLGSKPWVSVITPVYNGAPYLSQCIEGVLSQTHENFEYTLLDNCSTDQSLEIACRYAAIDSRIRVVKNDHFLDQISNFNYAASLVSPRAKYCKFAFADDLLLPSCLEQMVEVAESDPDVSVVSCYVSGGITVWSKGIPFGKTIISGREACRLYLLQGHSPFNSLNGLLFRADTVRRRNPFHRYNDGFFEDADLCFDMLKDSKLGFVHQILAFNRRDNTSTLSSITTYNPILVTDLLFLHRFGHYYLDQNEFERRWGEKMKEYRNFLSKNILRGRDEDFWTYHKKALEQIGCTLSKKTVAWNIFLILVDYALNPKSSIEKMFARISEKWAPDMNEQSNP
jgi:glycosyltransferase involved in cell wall biosynthesis